MKFRPLIMAAALALAVAATILSLHTSGDALQNVALTGKPCEPHSVADSLCTRCHPDLVAFFKEKGDWCSEHKMPESQCYLCNPSLAPKQVANPTAAEPQEVSLPESNPTRELDWCAEHRVPESECTKCNPGLIQSFKAKFDWCGSHGVPESHCYQCNQSLKFPQEAEFERLKKESEKKKDDKPRTSLFRKNVEYCATNDAVIQLASIQTADRTGLVFSEVAELPSSEIVEAAGETEFAPTASTVVTSLTTGTLVEWAVKPGDRVTRGQIIAWLESVEAAGLRANYLHSIAISILAENTLQRKEELARDGIASQKELLEARSEMARAQADLQHSQASLAAIGIGQEEPAGVNSSTNLVPIRSRRTGVLVEFQSAPGSILASGEPLALVADVSNLWVTAQIREKDLPKIRVGQPALIVADGNNFQKAQGRVIWISDAINPSTRTTPVRIEIARNGSALRARQFTQVEIECSERSDCYVVPETAVQWEGCCNVVFVAETADRIRPRKVTVEYASGASYIINGVKRGERIVTQGSYILKTELMKEGIGAGCCGVGA